MDWPFLYFCFEWALRLLALVVVPRRRSPTAGTTWLLVIFLLPEVGWIAFLLLGGYKLPKARRAIQDQINENIDTQITAIHKSHDSSEPIIDPTIPSKYQSLENLVQDYGRLPSLGSNSLTTITEYGESFKAMIADIEQAKSHVFVEAYTVTLDHATEPLFAALVRAKQRGVDVRVLYDSWGSRKFAGRKPMIQLLEQAGIDYKAMLPIRFPGRMYVRPDLRNHRKLVVIDDIIGYTGSQNLVNRHYARTDTIHYDELVVRTAGPIVLEMTALFVTDWISEGGEVPRMTLQEDTKLEYQSPGSIMQILPSGPGFQEENNLKVFTHMLHIARDEITIVNPYFVPPESLLSALTSASHRGVKVRMINSKAIDQWMTAYAQRSYYEMLLEAGIEIYLYHTPNLLHSKFIIIDKEVVVVGSSNMDMRSFELNSELSLLCYDDKIANDMNKLADTYIHKSSQLILADWLQRPLYRRILENIARLTAAVQ